MEKIEDLEIVQVDGVGDNLKATIAHDGEIYIEVEEPWAGDTESGFGRSGSIKLSKAQAELLACWLSQAADRK